MHYLCSVFIRFSIIKGVTQNSRVDQKQEEFLYINYTLDYIDLVFIQTSPYILKNQNIIWGQKSDYKYVNYIECYILG